MEKTGLEYQVVSFRFPRELTEVEENYVIGAFQSLRDEVKRKMQRTRAIFSNRIYQVIGGASSRTYVTLIDYILLRFDSLFKLDKLDEDYKVYEIWFAGKEFGSFDVAKNMNLPLMQKGITDKITDRLRGELKRVICSKIKIPEEEVITEIRTEIG